MTKEATIGIVVQALLPVVLAWIYCELNKTKFFNKIPEAVKQVIYGVTFGGIAIYCTEFGVPYSGAQVNVRDAAVLIAGLVFGAPAGIIAGLLGGIERYFAVYWGVGTYTQIACSVSTAIAGFYSAALRKIMFDDRKPSWYLALVIGLVMEVFHMTMVFLTNMDDTEKAMTVVKTCTVVMVPANAISTMLGAFVAQIIDGDFHMKKSQLSISQTIQRWLLISVAVMFVATTGFTYTMQTSITNEQVKNQLTQSIYDLVADVEDTSARNLLSITRGVEDKIGRYNLPFLCREYGVAEISIVNSEGIITESSNPEYVGFDMSSGEQAAEFLCLLGNTQEYVQEYGPITSSPDIYRKYAGIKTEYGFLQVGYGAEEFQDDIESEVAIAAKNKHIGETGYIIIANKDLRVVSAPENHKHSRISDYGFDISAEADVLNTGNIEGVDSFFIYSEAEGYYIVSVMPQEEGYKVRNVATYVNVFMQILAFAVLFAMIYNLIKVAVVASINRTNTALAKIIDGDLDEEVDVNTSAEFSELSNDINLTVGRLKDFIEEEKHRLEEEINYAKNIQENALPQTFPNDNKYEIYALMEAAKGVGGDFYDFYKTTRHGVNFMIADVSGKGIPGAMFMMRAKAELHTLTETGIPVNEVFTYGNERLCQGNEAGMFVTAWEGNINLETGHVQFANAGHNPPVIMRTDGTVEFIRGKVGFVLAGMEGVQYKLQELDMQEGDIIFLYTDGVVEATNLDHELYGEDRLIECLKNVDKTVSMDYLCCEVIGDVGRFVGEAEQFDDITMLALRYKGNHENDHNKVHVEVPPNMYTLSGKPNE